MKTRARSGFGSEERTHESLGDNRIANGYKVVCFLLIYIFVLHGPHTIDTFSHDYSAHICSHRGGLLPCARLLSQAAIIFSRVQL
jgi:hypothetical protein